MESVNQGQSLCITGGSGFLGSALCHRLKDDPAYGRIVILSRDYHKQEALRRALGDDPKFRWFIGDVRDLERLRLALRGIDHVIHAAALKSVPVCEYDPLEALLTNAVGTANVLRAALDCGVARVLAISSDKSSAPHNFYGASKLCAERLAVAMNAYAGANGTRFSAVKYGNVVGSAGSVIPLFLRQRETGTLTLTHERMTRFWITAGEACELVLRCLREMRGGEVFVPHLPSTTVLDLATAIAPEARIEVVGIRPGEKMHEVMLTPEESRTARDLGWAYVVPPPFPFWAGMTYPTVGSPVPEGWTYTSASAPRLTSDEIKGMLD